MIFYLILHPIQVAIPVFLQYANKNIRSCKTSTALFQLGLNRDGHGNSKCLLQDIFTL